MIFPPSANLIIADISIHDSYQCFQPGARFSDFATRLTHETRNLAGFQVSDLRRLIPRSEEIIPLKCYRRLMPYWKVHVIDDNLQCNVRIIETNYGGDNSLSMVEDIKILILSIQIYPVFYQKISKSLLQP